MKILFIIQGEGRGHLTQALSLRQKLMAEGHEIVGVLVGKSPAFADLPFPVIVFHPRFYGITQEICISVLICRCRSHKIILPVDDPCICQGPVSRYFCVRMDNVFRREKTVNSPLKCSVPFCIPVG